jgi:hypothetical protein
MKVLYAALHCNLKWVLQDFGLALRVLREVDLPIFGMCLGHQGMAVAFGGAVSLNMSRGSLAPFSNSLPFFLLKRWSLHLNLSMVGFATCCIEQMAFSTVFQCHYPPFAIIV